MFILFILGIALGAFAVVFDLQNISPVTVSFYSWHLESSLALVIALSLAIGLLIAVLLMLPELIANYFKYRGILKDNNRLATELLKEKEANYALRQRMGTTTSTVTEVNTTEHTSS